MDADSFPLDRERKDVYYLTIEAEDGGHRRSTVSVEIHLTDLNDNAPKCDRSQYDVSLDENRRQFSNGPLTISVCHFYNDLFNISCSVLIPDTTKRLYWLHLLEFHPMTSQGGRKSVFFNFRNTF